ncbi:MAG: competence/damage-inducible protein A [Acidimicrobiia bacterium]
MRCDVLAVGTELLLGQIVDTNSAWIGETLAAAGIDTFEHVKVGDNQARIARALRRMVAEADAVIVCGGLGPTPDDVTREAIAEVMGVGLERREELGSVIEEMFRSRGRSMPLSNLRQAEVPEGAEPISNPVGTAPGLIAEIGDSVVYAVPGVPREMQRMVRGPVLADLFARGGGDATIVSRTIKTWGTSESALAELISDRVAAQTNPTIAFLARGIEGLAVRLTAKSETPEVARAAIAAEEKELLALLGHLVFAFDESTMEQVVLGRLDELGWTLGVAESLTGGLVGARLAAVPGASRSFRGSVVSYAAEVKRSLLGVTAEKVVSEECASEMALGARRVLGADVGLAVTGVAGPESQDGEPVGTVILGIVLPDAAPETVRISLPGERQTVRDLAVVSLLDLLRRRLPTR